MHTNSIPGDPMSSAETAVINQNASAGSPNASVQLGSLNKFHAELEDSEQGAHVTMHTLHHVQNLTQTSVVLTAPRVPPRRIYAARDSNLFNASNSEV